MRRCSDTRWYRSGLLRGIEAAILRHHSLSPSFQRKLEPILILRIGAAGRSKMGSSFRWNDEWDLKGFGRGSRPSPG